MSLASILIRLRPACPLVSSLRSLSLSCRLDNAVDVETKIPKRPASPWVRYFTANYPLVKAAQPGLSTSDIMKQLSAKWKLLSENQKTQFVTAYEKDKAMYKSKVSKISENELVEASKESAKKRAGKLKNKAQSELNDLLSSLKKPARPYTAYMMYVTSRMTQVNAKGLKGTEAVKAIAVEWRDLNDQQKLSFARKAEDASEQYKKELVAWTNKMNKMGQLEAIMEAEAKVAMAKTKLKQIVS